MAIIGTSIELTLNVNISGNSDAQETEASALMDRIVSHLKDLTYQLGDTVAAIDPASVSGWPLLS